jgi:hypothetical protein
MEITANRPWQGTTVGVLNIIGIVFSALMVLGLLLGGAAIATALEEAGMAILAGVGTTIIAIALIPIIILAIFITIGLFKGQKWSVIVSLVLTALSALGSVFTFNIFGIIIYGFVIYCLVACMKDPYYN